MLINAVVRITESGATSGAKRLTGFEIQIILRELYEEAAGIAKLDDKNRPLALVADHPTDGLRRLWPMHNRRREFALYEVYKYYGLSWIEFQSLPREEVTAILDELREAKARERRLRNSIQGDLEAGNIPDIGRRR